MSDDYTIIGLEPESAREYVLAVMTTLKAATAKRGQVEKDLELWEQRATLAIEKNREDLAVAARERAAELKSQIAKLGEEMKGYQEGLARMMAQLRQMRAQATLTVDADLLLAQMQMMVGENAESDAKFRAASAEWALDDLKKRMNEES